MKEVTVLLDRPLKVAARRLVTPAACVVAAIAIGAAASSREMVRVALVAALLSVIVTLGLRAPRLLILATLAWLPLLGLFRRLLSSTASPTSLDPLLLVAPAAVALLALVAARAGAFAKASQLSKAVFVLSLLILLSVLNPLQTNVTVGLAGLLFVLVPTLWFWVGRVLVDDRAFRQILVLLGVLGLFSALYGLRQTLIGFPSFDQAWIDTQGYEALRVGSSFRAFGPFVAASDYGFYLGIAFVALAALAWRRRAAIPCLVALVFIGWALLLASGRGIIMLVVIALGIMMAAKRGVGPAAAAVVGVTCLVGLSLLASRFDPEQFKDPRTSGLLAHQVQGLASPFDEEQSTLPGHYQLLTHGLDYAWSQPLGRGVGVITLAGEKFGRTTIGTEADPSNMGVALGFPGIIAYFWVAALGFTRAYRMARTKRDVLSVVVLGVLVVTSLQWFAGGNYAMAPFPWLMLGWLDRPATESLESPEEGDQPDQVTVSA